MPEQQQQGQRLCPCPCREPLSEGKHFTPKGCDQKVRIILGRYDPDELKTINWNGVPTDGAWRGFEPLVLKLRERQRAGDW